MSLGFECDIAGKSAAETGYSENSSIYPDQNRKKHSSQGVGTEL